MQPMRAESDTKKRKTRKSRGRVGSPEPASPRAIDTRNTTDPGDATGRNFRYQYAYGVMLLVASRVGQRPYIAIWCEHHEDFLAEHSDRTFDAYQIKTSRPERGPWKMSDDELVKTVGRFVEHLEAFGAKLGRLFFVSNTECDTVTDQSHDDRRRSRCPLLFLRHIRDCKKESDVQPPFDRTFRELQAECGCAAQPLLEVLKRLDIILGPSRTDFEAVISNQHLPLVEGCGNLSTRDLNEFRDELIARVHQASTLQVTDSIKYLRSVIDGHDPDPVVEAKRLVVSEIVVYDEKRPKFRFTGAPELALGQSPDFSVLEQKLTRGHLGDQVDRMRSLGRDAEYNLLEDISARPELYPDLLRTLEQLVLGECSEAHLRARQGGEPYGDKMLIEVQDRLRNLSQDSALVGDHRYECLLGLAALLTSACRVWWSPRFILSAERSP